MRARSYPHSVTTFAGTRGTERDLHSMLTRRNCPICSSERRGGFGRKADLDVFECLSCAGVYSSSVPPDDEIESLYATYGYEELRTAPAFVRHQLERIATALARHRRLNRILDVGFGAGDFLEAAVQAGWNAEGIEKSTMAVEQARRRGLSASHGDFLSAEFDGTFDVVVMLEVVEHVRDPVGYIRRAYRVLRTGGCLFVTTPNATSLSRRLLGVEWAMIAPREHLQLFSPRGLETALTSAGFRADVTSSGFNPAPLVHKLRRARDANPQSADAVAVNEAFTRTAFRRAAKWTLNVPLKLLKIGDTLKANALRIDSGL